MPQVPNRRPAFGSDRILVAPKRRNRKRKREVGPGVEETGLSKQQFFFKKILFI